MTTRRTFLIVGGSAAVAGGAGWLWVRGEQAGLEPPLGGPIADPRAPASPLDFPPFDEVAQRVLTRMYDDLIPGDEGLPSASEAGVMVYVTSMAKAAGFTAVRNRLVKLSRWLDLEAQRRFGAAYVDLPDEGRQQILAVAEAQPSSRGFDVSSALRLALQAGLEGYLGHPKHRNAEPFTIWNELGVRMPRDPAMEHHHT